MNIVDLSGYKEYTGINSPNGDEKLQPIVDMVNDIITRYCNRNFTEAPTETTEITSAFNNEILLDKIPSVSVVSAQYKQGGEWVDLDEEDLYLTPETSILEYLGSTSLPEDRRSIKVVYTYGEVVPYAIVQAGYELITHYSKREFIASKGLGDGQTVSFEDPKTFPVQVRTILDLYRVM